MPAAIEAEAIAQRRLGLNRYEIYAVLRERRIIKDKRGELGHADLKAFALTKSPNPAEIPQSAN
jgi:hypothetical protein